MDKETLIKKSIEIHGDKYDFSLVSSNFTTKEKLPIICPLHGIFYKSSEKFIGSKQGCQNVLVKKDLIQRVLLKKQLILSIVRIMIFQK